MKLLLPVDGSEASNRAIDHLVNKLAWFCKEPLEVHLLNVQPAVSRNVGSFVGRDAIVKYHQEEGMKALRRPMRRLDAEKIDYRTHIGVGDPAETIAGYAKKQRCDLVLMGTRGLGSVSSLVLGSVATKVIHLAPVPVLLVK